MIGQATGPISHHPRAGSLRRPRSRSLCLTRLDLALLALSPPNRPRDETHPSTHIPTINHLPARPMRTLMFCNSLCPSNTTLRSDYVAWVREVRLTHPPSEQPHAGKTHELPKAHSPHTIINMSPVPFDGPDMIISPFLSAPCLTGLNGL